MSIWSSGETVGYDDAWGESMARDGVLTYADGWSNHYPVPGDPEKPAFVDLATIPHWCVPGWDDGDAKDDVTGPWVRMAVATWMDDHGSPMIHDGATVNLNPDAARALGKALIDWADSPHVEPRVRP